MDDVVTIGDLLKVVAGIIATVGVIGVLLLVLGVVASS